MTSHVAPQLDLVVSFAKSASRKDDIRLGYFSSSTARTTIAPAPYQSKASVDRIKSRSIDDNAMPAITCLFFVCVLKKTSLYPEARQTTVYTFLKVIERWSREEKGWRKRGSKPWTMNVPAYAIFFHKVCREAPHVLYIKINRRRKREENKQAGRLLTNPTSSNVQYQSHHLAQ